MEEKTYFAPALRASSEKILDEYELVASQKFFNEVFGSITGIGAIINKNRQIVYANGDFLKMLGVDTLEPILGKRPGEVISCVHSEEESGGCGTSMSCAYCGAVRAILESQKTGVKSSRETLITTLSGGKLKSLDLNIISTPVILSGEVFYALIIRDISDEKRRLALERIFFHDLLNSAGGLNGLLTLLKDGVDPGTERKLIDLSESASRAIIEEIMLHRQIRAAENGDLQLNLEPVNSLDMVKSVISKIGFHQAGKNKKILIAKKSYNIVFETDNLLLQRVLMNMLKNALEASKTNETITIGVDDLNDKIRFWVKNAGVIPADVKLQLFQRSFSTKGTGRGLGTYSIRLLTENYLNGTVTFVSNEKEGTIFRVDLRKIFHGKQP